jgi:chorismate synthase
VRGALVQMGPHKIDRANWDWDEVDRNPFFSPDAAAAGAMGRLSRRRPQERLVDRRGDRGGGVGRAAGLGAPIYGKLDQEIASAMMSINAVKGVEIGAGFEAAAFPARRTPTRCERATTASRVPVEQRRRDSGRHFHRQEPWSCASR